MSEPAKCIAVTDAVEDTVVLAFQLLDKSIASSPKLVIEALKSSQVQTALTSSLQSIAKGKLQDAPVQFSAEDARKLSESLRDTNLKGFKDGLLGQVKKSPEYQRLEKSAERIAEALKCTPVGVWVDKNEGLVYVLGGGLILGGAVALYVTRSGDAVTNPLVGLIKDKKPKVKVLGNLELSGSLLKFVPSSREIELNAQAVAKWEKLEVELNITVHTVNEKIEATGGGKVVLPFSGGQMRLEGTYNARDPKVAPFSLGLGLQLNPKGVRIDILGRMQFQGDLRPSGGSVDLRVGPSRKFPFGIGATGKVEQGNGTILGTLDFPF